MLAVLSLAISITLSQQIEAVLQNPKLKGSIVGITVQKEGGQVLFEHNSGLRLMPASNQKIISNLYALESLGPEFRPQTRFWKEGNNIIIDAPGDPSITHKQLAEARSHLSPHKSARIYVRQAYSPRFGPGWEEDDLAFRYAAPISSLTVNKGEFPVLNSGGIPVVPVWTGIKVRHKSGSKALQVTFDRDNSVVNVTGSLKPESAMIGRFAIPNPAAAACRILGGQMFTTSAIPNRPPDYTITGPILMSLVQNCLEPSDNVIAENLLLMASMSETQRVSNYSISNSAAAKFYKDRLGLDATQLTIHDGSGLSRHNIVTPNAVARILQHALTQSYRKAFIQALPQAGEGTLGSRLPRVPISAKTGTLDMVSALSGYVENRNKELIVFSIIFNHYSATSSEIRGFQDQIVNAIRSADE